MVPIPGETRRPPNPTSFELDWSSPEVQNLDRLDLRGKTRGKSCGGKVAGGGWNPTKNDTLVPRSFKQGWKISP